MSRTTRPHKNARGRGVVPDAASDCNTGTRRPCSTCQFRCPASILLCGSNIPVKPPASSVSYSARMGPKLNEVPTNPQCILQSMMCLALIETNLGAALHVCVEQPFDDKQCAFNPSNFRKAMARSCCRGRAASFLRS